MLDSETKRRIDSCRDILVGKVPDPKSQVEQITIALIYKFMDDMDAEAEALGGKRSFFTGEFAKYGWSNLMAPGMGGFDMLSLYSEAIGKMNENPGVPALFRDIFKNAYLPYRDPETLRGFLKEINGFTYDHSERLGDAFEYLLSVLGSQGDAGQFRTPRHIIDFMVELIDPKKDESILDPACGTAGFLISSYKHILKHNTKGYKAQQDREAFDETGVSLEALTLDNPLHYKGDLLTPDDKKRLAANIRGYDISPDMVRLSLVNMYLHGFASPHIDEYDTLTSDEKWNELADIILANPPFMSPKGGIKPHKRFSVAATRSEVLFVDYIAEHLTPNGRAAVIVPEGIIFQSGNAYKQLREMLVKHYLVAVISLPAGVFNPYSGVKTSILVMDKRLAKKTGAILFVKIGSDGYHLGAQRRPVDHNDLPAAVHNIKGWLESVRNGAVLDAANIANLSLVAKERIGENGEWNLSGERYTNSQTATTIFEMVSLTSICDINPETIDPTTVYAGKTFEYIDISAVENETGKFESGNVIPSAEAPSRARRKVRSGDVLISTVRPNLKAFTLLKNPSATAIASTGFAVLRVKPNSALPEFVLLMLRSQSCVDQMIGMMGKGAYPSINQKDVESVNFPLPPLEVQKEIVAEIEGYQKIIDGARQVVENYQPRIPINPDWPMVELGTLANMSSGGTPSKSQSEYWQGDIPWVSPKDMKTDLIKDTEDHISQIAITNSATKLVDAGTVLCVVRSGILQHTFPVAITTRSMCFNQDIIAISTDSTRLDSKYLLYMFKTIAQQILSEGIKPGVTVQSVHSGFFRSLKLPLPDLNTQRTIVAKIEAELRLVNANKELIRLFEDKIKAVINRVWGETA
ncbi:N-6 DNA methylase [Nitrosomonas sp.]|uniref:N-6 DNA methylase n=1 Tax=Nitrosomonas sp. TaxID=42353 RepID=UPI001DA53035|nr:N-6 DNA methylase [Nitrosomonas sp.]MBX3615965.1 N-6 DNA methylase [Nitrosomonas sp.]